MSRSVLYRSMSVPGDIAGPNDTADYAKRSPASAETGLLSTHL